MERLLSRPSAERKIPVVMRLEATPDGFALNVDGCRASIVCEHQTAEKPQRDNIIRQLTRLGGTPYVCSDVELPADFNYFIPSSLLAELRRKAVSAFTPPSVPNEQSSSAKEVRKVSEAPSYPIPYLYNVANSLSRDFYDALAVRTAPAFEVKEPRHAVLMQCRHCLRYALGCCVKHGGRRPQWREPLALQLADGRRFPLEFACRHCQMNVLTDA